MTSVHVLLCLACSQSLSEKSLAECFRTPCCGKVICDRCLSKNVRLRRYNPCLSCLGGVGLVQGTSRDRESGDQPPLYNGTDNEAETFVLGDSDDEADEPEPPSRPAATTGSVRPPSPPITVQVSQPPQSSSSSTREPIQSTTYYIKPRDTVNGIALRYGVDPRRLCQMNKLPISTINTTPHLLHTRTTLQLPPGSRAPSPPPPDLQERLEARARERAGRAFQAITKETDWGIAQTYVALLDVEDDTIKEGKRRMIDPNSKGGRQALAVDQYLDDNAWEEEQRKAGLSPRIEGFPYFSPKGKENVKPDKESTSNGSSDWWQRLWQGSSRQ